MILDLGELLDLLLGLAIMAELVLVRALLELFTLKLLRAERHKGINKLHRVRLKTINCRINCTVELHVSLILFVTERNDRFGLSVVLVGKRTGVSFHNDQSGLVCSIVT